MLGIGYFFLGFHFVTTGNVFLFLPVIQKRKNIKALGNLIHNGWTGRRGGGGGLRFLVQKRKPHVSMLLLLHIKHGGTSQ
jgi:hypothetical protein